MIPIAFSDADPCEDFVPEHICARTSLLRSPARRTGLVSSRGSGNEFMSLSFLYVVLSKYPGSYAVAVLCPRDNVQ